MKMQDQLAGMENAGQKCVTNLQGWKMREKLVWKAKV